MKNVMKLIILTTSILTIASCGTKEEIIPSTPKEEITFGLKIPLDPFEVEDQFSDIEEVDVIGGVFRELAEMMADAEIQEGDLGKFAFTPCLYAIDELADIDFSYIRSINLNKVNLEVESADPIANLSFVEFANIYARFIDKEEYEFLKNDFSACTAESGDEEKSEESEINYWDLDTSNMSLIMSYDKNQHENIGKIINPTIHQKEYRDILKEKQYVLLFLKVKIDKAPSYDFTIKGEMDLRIDIDLQKSID